MGASRPDPLKIATSADEDKYVNLSTKLSLAEKCFDIWGILKMATVKSV